MNVNVMYWLRERNAYYNLDFLLKNVSNEVISAVVYGVVRICSARVWSMKPLTVGLIQRTPYVLEERGPSSLKPSEVELAGKRESSNKVLLWRHCALSISKSCPKNLTAIWFWPRPWSRSHWLRSLAAIPVAYMGSITAAGTWCQINGWQKQ